LHDNDSLLNLTGLENLTYIGGSLNLGRTQPYPYYGNPSLINLTGLGNLTRVEGDLNIAHNSSLVNLFGLNNLTTIEGNLAIKSNGSLINLSGLENLSSIEGDLTIGGYYGGNGSLEDISALSNLTSIGGGLQIGPYPGTSNKLKGLEGLQNITSVGYILITGNDSLISLEALSNLNYVSLIEIRDNQILKSLAGLENVFTDSIDRFHVVGNDSLSYCQIQNMCEYLEMYDDYSHIYIFSNAPGCNSQEEVRDSCEVVTIEEITIAGGIISSPNPFTTSTTLSYELRQPENVSLSIYNHLGQLVYQTQETQPQGSQQLIWNAEGYPEGVYYYRLKTGGEVASGKLIKVE
jgi:hypothetical protein